MIERLKTLLLELDSDFVLIGQQRHLEIDGHGCALICCYSTACAGWKAYPTRCWRRKQDGPADEEMRDVELVRTRERLAAAKLNRER